MIDREALCYLCNLKYNEHDFCFFRNTQLRTNVYICADCIKYAVDDIIKNMWFYADPDSGEGLLKCPYCPENVTPATYECILVKQDIRYVIKMHAGCFEENIGIGM